MVVVIVVEVESGGLDNTIHFWTDKCACSLHLRMVMSVGCVMILISSTTGSSMGKETEKMGKGIGGKAKN